MKYLSMITAALLLGATGCDEKKPAVDPGPTGPDGPAEIVAPNAAISTAEADIAKGKEMFTTRGCVACHKVGGGKLVGPDLQDVLVRRTQPWVEKMILKPEVMLAKDDAAKAMLKQLLIPMPNQAIHPEKDLPALMAYLKSESKGAPLEAAK